MVIGLSHSEIRGLMVICTYPQLIAAYHVLHRLHEPRHPPCALNYFLYASAQPQLVRRAQPILQLYRLHGLSSPRDSLLFLQSCLCQYVKDLMRNEAQSGE